MSFVTFFTSLFNILSLGDTIMIFLLKVPLFIDAAVYTLVAYTFKVFLLIANINFNTLSDIVEPLITRIKALVIVFIVYKLGLALIGFLAGNPDDVTKDGVAMLKNIFITAALLLSYNFIFGVLNEVSLLVMGNQIGYKYTILNQVFDLNEDENNGNRDPGLILRAVFGSDAETIDDPGNYLAFGVAKLWITQRVEGNESIEGDMYSKLCTSGTVCDFFKLTEYSEPIWKADPSTYAGQKLKYMPIIGIIIGAFIIYSMVKGCIEVGVRMFKLIILQFLAPLACLCVLGKDGTKDKHFSAYLKAYSKTYLSAFIRVATILIITVFVTQFFKNINKFVPNLAGLDFFTSALIMIVVAIAGYSFANKVPKFIDESLALGMDWGEMKNVVGGLLGAGIGGAAGFIGGLRAGGKGNRLASAFGGLGKGAKAGWDSTSKGDKISDLFKAPGAGNKAGVELGSDIRSRGGLKNIVAGGIKNTFGVGTRQDREINDLNAEQQALDDYAAAEKYAVKDTKAGVFDSDEDKNAFNSATGNEFADMESKFSDGLKDIKLGEDKDTYANKAFSLNKDYQAASAAYDYMNSGQDLADADAQLNIANQNFADANTKVDAANSDLASATTEYDAATSELSDATAEFDAANAELAAASEGYDDAVAEFEAAKANFEEGDDVEAMYDQANSDFSSAEEEINQALTEGRSETEMTSLYAKRAFAQAQKERCESYVNSKRAVDRKTAADARVAEATTRKSDAEARVTEATTRKTEASESVAAATKARKEAEDAVKAKRDEITELHKNRDEKLAAKKEAAESARHDAEELLKKYHDKRKDYEASKNADAKAKKTKFINLRNKNGHGSGNEWDGVKGEGKKIHNRKAEIVNSPSYDQTHHTKKNS